MATHTQPTDIFNTGSDGLDFSASGDTWIIEPNVFVTSQTFTGVDSNGFSNNTVINNGYIASLGSNKFGVNLYNGTEILINEGGADIFSAGTSAFSAGVHFNGNTGNHLDNLGNITGARSGVTYDQNAAGNGAFNIGTIFGEFAGIFNESFFDGGRFTNAGTIASSHIGIDFVTPVTTLAINITNLVGAGIFGPTRAIATNGILDLTNRGEIVGDVLVNNSGASVIVNKGAILGQVFLNDGGNDTFNGTGGTSGTITATGNDKIMLGKGSAQVHVGGGSDIITAGPGHDRFIFDSALTGQLEQIKKFTHGHDTIVLSLSDFPMLGALGQLNTGHFDFGHATKAHPEIIYNQGNGFLSYDANGNAPGGLHHFATLLGAPTISHADFTLVA